jgi:hypothetical protein
MKQDQLGNLVRAVRLFSHPVSAKQALPNLGDARILRHNWSIQPEPGDLQGFC